MGGDYTLWLKDPNIDVGSTLGARDFLREKPQSEVGSGEERRERERRGEKTSGWGS